MKQLRGNILILDDDASFRSLVRQILESRGFSVVEASTPEAAMALFASNEPVLAIVDYRLPNIDGITWIEKLRASGRNMPVVFCSAIPCDSSTFNRLRNILKVALIVRKPIIPESFIEQLESLLPGYQKDYMQVGMDDGRTRQFYSAQSSTQDMVAELSSLKKRLELERALQVAKADYLKELDSSWRMLTELIDIHNNDKSRMDVLIEAEHIAHRIRGTAGSLGLELVSEIAGKLEDLMQNLDGREDTDQDIIWFEVIRVLAVGQTEILANNAETETEDSEWNDRPSVLIVSASDDVLNAVGGRDVQQIARIEIANSPEGVAACLAKQRIDAMFLEITSNKEISFQRAADIRQMPNNHALPLGVFTTPDLILSEIEQLYIGASVMVPHPVEGAELIDALDRLLAMSSSERPRVLAVDDDEVLCRFVGSVLESERIETRTCTNPTLVNDIVAKFQPDVILLDVMMPAVTGYEVCRRIRENPEWQNIPVIFLTSKTSAESRNAAFAVGANDFITKPVLAAELIHRVNNQLIESGLKRLSRTRDPETGVMNGDAVMAQAKLMLGDHLLSSAPMTVALLTIDDYDQLPLVQGQFAARQAAKCLGDLLQQRFRSEDLRGRWSDGGYVLIFGGCERELVAGALELLQSDFSRIEFTDGVFPFTATFSAGIADSKRDGDRLEEIIKSAHRRIKLGTREGAGAIGVAG